MAKRAMGKGLSAILGEEIRKVNKVTDAGAEKLVGQVAMISLNAITTNPCLLYTSPSPRDAHESRMPSSA